MTKDYTIRLMRRGDVDLCVAEIEVCGVTATKKEMIAHYTKFAKLFMRHVKFDYVTTR